MFSPPLMLMSLLRSLILTWRSGLSTARSPVWTQPPSKDYSVATGLFR
jgi:hypothetical protein